MAQKLRRNKASIIMTTVPTLILQQHRKQCLMRIVLMARTFRLLSDEGLLGIAYDSKQRGFSVVGVVAEEVLEEEEEKKISFSCDEVSEPESEVSHVSSSLMHCVTD